MTISQNTPNPAHRTRSGCAYREALTWKLGGLLDSKVACKVPAIAHRLLQRTSNATATD